MDKSITASKLYDYIQCPHKVWRDLYGPQEEKIHETNPFLELLWNKGVQHEQTIIGQLGEYLDLSEGALEERFLKTMDAMKNGVSRIYQGVLINDNLIGIPDLLEKITANNYMPIDIKSGMAFEDSGDDESGRPKKHYAVQLCLYNDLLKQLHFCDHDQGTIIDVNTTRVAYNLKEPMGVRQTMTWWECYEQIKSNVDVLLNNQDSNKPAISGTCKLCPWHDSCIKWCEATDDLTRIFYLGRNIRDIINDDLHISKTKELLDIDIDEVTAKKNNDKSFLPGIGKVSLSKYIQRVRVMSEIKSPVLYEDLDLPCVSTELFFDIEDDPTQDFVYLHGVYERSKKGSSYKYFVAEDFTREAEKYAWSEFWKYINSLPINDYAVYYYSHHEKTTYKRMQKKYPDVITEDKLEQFFDQPNVIDLYNIVQKKTDWPVGSYSLKTLAHYLGFNWTDKTPSGALSIQWFNEYLMKQDDSIMQRILTYNEDDCKATMVLKDKLVSLTIKAVEPVIV